MTRLIPKSIIARGMAYTHAWLEYRQFQAKLVAWRLEETQFPRYGEVHPEVEKFLHLSQRLGEKRGKVCVLLRNASGRPSIPLPQFPWHPSL